MSKDGLTLLTRRLLGTIRGYAQTLLDESEDRQNGLVLMRRTSKRLIDKYRELSIIEPHNYKEPNVLYCYRCGLMINLNEYVYRKTRGKGIQKYYHEICAEEVNLI